MRATDTWPWPPNFLASRRKVVSFPGLPLSGVGSHLVDEFPPVLVVPLLADLDEAVLADQCQRRGVVRADAGADHPHGRLTAGPLQQDLQRGAGIAPAAELRDDRVTDLDHAVLVRRTVEPGLADHPTADAVPDGARDPRRHRRILPDLRAAEPPGPDPARRHEHR